MSSWAQPARKIHLASKTSSHFLFRESASKLSSGKCSQRESVFIGPPVLTAVLSSPSTLRMTHLLMKSERVYSMANPAVSAVGFRGRALMWSVAMNPAGVLSVLCRDLMKLRTFLFTNVEPKVKRFRNKLKCVQLVCIYILFCLTFL